jgi:Domain of unknown function (DUF4440)
MKPTKLSRIFIYSCILLVISASLHAQSEDSKRLIALEKRRFEAMVRRDTTLLSGLLADSLVYIHSSGIIENKISFIKDIASGHITYIFIYPEKVTAVIDGNYGWIYGRANIRFKLSTMTTTIDQYVSFVEVYFLKRYQWQMVLCHNARVEKNAPYFNNAIPQVIPGSVPSIY